MGSRLFRGATVDGGGAFLDGTGVDGALGFLDVFLLRVSTSDVGGGGKDCSGRDGDDGSDRIPCNDEDGGFHLLCATLLRGSTSDGGDAGRSDGNIVGDREATFVGARRLHEGPFLGVGGGSGGSDANGDGGADNRFFGVDPLFAAT